jgi:glycosyltransferase involved in cell wall biosynthesis
MRFSLVVATLGRPEICRLLLSLSRQTNRDFEVIVVEQGDGNSVAEAVAEFSDRLILKHLRSTAAFRAPGTRR